MSSSSSEGRGEGKHALEGQVWSRPGTLGVDWRFWNCSLVLQAGRHGSKDRENGGEKPRAPPCLMGKAEREALKSLGWINSCNFKCLLGVGHTEPPQSQQLAPGLLILLPVVRCLIAHWRWHQASGEHTGCQSASSGSSKPALPPLSFKGTAFAWIREPG